MEMTDENVALAVLLTELMTANMPGGDSDYYTRRNWETSFTSQIQNFKKTNNINQRLDLLPRRMLKYGNSEEKMLDFLSNAKSELKTITFSDYRWL